jgi:hypothetical protein
MIYHNLSRSATHLSFRRIIAPQQVTSTLQGKDLISVERNSRREDCAKDRVTSVSGDVLCTLRVGSLLDSNHLETLFASVKPPPAPTHKIELLKSLHHQVSNTDCVKRIHGVYASTDCDDTRNMQQYAHLQSTSQKEYGWRSTMRKSLHGYLQRASIQCWRRKEYNIEHNHISR